MKKKILQALKFNCSNYIQIYSLSFISLFAKKKFLRLFKPTFPQNTHFLFSDHTAVFIAYFIALANGLPYAFVQISRRVRFYTSISIDWNSVLVVISTCFWNRLCLAISKPLILRSIPLILYSFFNYFTLVCPPLFMNHLRCRVTFGGTVMSGSYSHWQQLDVITLTILYAPNPMYYPHCRRTFITESILFPPLLPWQWRLLYITPWMELLFFTIFYFLSPLYLVHSAFHFISPASHLIMNTA